MIKQCVLGLAIASILTGCGEDREKTARTKIGAISVAFDARPQGTPNASGTRTLTRQTINQCVEHQTKTKADFDVIRKDYAETQAVQSMETKALYGKVRGQLATCQQTKATLDY